MPGDFNPSHQLLEPSSQSSLAITSSSVFTGSRFIRADRTKAFRRIYPNVVHLTQKPSISWSHTSTTVFPYLVPSNAISPVSYYHDSTNSSSYLFQNLTTSELPEFEREEITLQQNISSHLLSRISNTENKSSIFDANFSTNWINNTDFDHPNFSFFDEFENYSISVDNLTSINNPVATIVTATILGLMILSTVVGKYLT